jgi:lipopolysaccharide/colanic/teichoic acid biosynthesis glycosyltransferase
MTAPLRRQRAPDRHHSRDDAMTLQIHDAAARRPAAPSSRGGIRPELHRPRRRKVETEIAGALSFVRAEDAPELIVDGAEEALPRASSRAERLAKDALDRSLALVLLASLSPLMLAVAALVRISSPGEVLFAQERVGRGGRTFRMLKFRSMCRDAHRHEDRLARSGQGPFFKVHADDRVTTIGRLLRRMSLDELPQLVNVLRGEMSIVGPRPLMVREHRLLPAEIRAWRVAVRPGLTGLWQVSGRSSTTPSTRIRLDRLYVARASVRLDLAIIARTPAAVLRGEGAV